MPLSLRTRARSGRWAARTEGWQAFLVGPARIPLQVPCLNGVVGVVRVDQGELNCRSGPKCASMGFAQEALVGVKHSSTLFFRPGPPADLAALVGGQVVQDHVDRGTVRSGGPDRLQRGQGWGGAFVAAVDTPQAGPAWRRSPGRWIPSRSWPAGTSRRGARAGSAGPRGRCVPGGRYCGADGGRACGSTSG